MIETSGTAVVFEDDPAIADLVDTYLRREGFRVLQTASGEDGLEIVKRENPRVLIVDIGLAGVLSGIDVCKQVRSTSSVPIVILSARGDEGDRVLGLELGADDYMTKPFSPRELVARVQAILRRSDQSGEPSAPVLTVGNVTVNNDRREVTQDGVLVELASKEFDLLAFFLQREGKALSRQQILDSVWGPGWYGDERTIDVHVRQLRKKLGDDFPLSTVRGVGYRFK